MTNFPLEALLFLLRVDTQSPVGQPAGACFRGAPQDFHAQWSTRVF